MAQDLRKVNDIESLMTYFSENLGWAIDPDDYYDIDDITYDFDASDLGLKEEAFAKISSLKQLRPLVDEQRWGIFFVNFESNRFEVSALRKILSGLIPARRNANHAVWDKKDLLFLCTWGDRNKVTIGAAHFEDAEKGLPQIKMISCEPAAEDFTQINIFEQRLAKLAWPSNPSDTAAWHEAWASAFTTRYRQTIQDSHTLTIRLAEEAQNIRDRILSTMEIETSNGYVHLLFEKFRATLVHDMTEQQFADMYAQTVVYGLFSARCMDESQEDFNASEAVECIPNTNPFLKGLLQECLGSNSAKSKLSFDELEVGNIVDLLLHTKTDSIITDFNRQTGGGREDPVIHFYEEFLSEYDKTQRVQRGVYYTPQPVVNFIVRAVDDILKHEFDVQDGLASTEIKKIKYKRESKKRRDGYFKTMVEDEMEVPAIQILDPATGTGTFLRQVILQIYTNFCASRRGMSREHILAEWNQYVPEHLLPRLNGFELMMAPYAVAHMKLAMILKDTGYLFDSNERLQVFLTNTLEKPGNSEAQLTLFDDPLAFESISANAVKKNTGINVVLGNPPYAGESSNKGPYIMELMELYKKEPGGLKKLNEKNPKWLNDDYVKFIRYAQEVTSRTDGGIVAFINPHGFIGNPTFRGMRWSLLQAFDYIYILDLHGNSNRKETCPDGSKDENVFDIQQGVSICFFIKKAKGQRSGCRTFHADLYGTRDKKYDFLNSQTISSVDFEEITPQAPDYLFKKVDADLRKAYDKGFSVDKLFKLGAVGIITARDGLTLDFDKKQLYHRIDDFRSLNEEVARQKYGLGKDVRDWKVSWAQNDINQNAVQNGMLQAEKFIPIMYRIFDIRYMLYTGTSRGLVCYPRTEVTEQFLLGDNLGFATGRTNKSPSCDHFFAVNMMAEVKCAERTTGSIIYPLYVYSRVAGKLVKDINMDKEVIAEFSKAIGLEFTPFSEYDDGKHSFGEKDIFYYMYAILYSEQYRSKYYEFLKAEYPKVPYPSGIRMFAKLRTIGQKLVNAHTMQDILPSTHGTAFVSEGGNTVEKLTFKGRNLYINKKSYFSNISDAEWEYVIGGYQVMQRWYKDRKNRTLSNHEISTFLQIIEIIRLTRELQEQIDKIVNF